MTEQEKNVHVLDDYAVFLRALLPNARGFLCHDRHRQLLWSELATGDLPAFPESYDAALAEVLRTEGNDPSSGRARVAMGRTSACVLRLEGDARRTLGALTVLLDAEGAQLPVDFVAGVLQPALRSLRRELALRLRLREGQRKLMVQAAEERLLHQVEKTVHADLPCERALRRILKLCEEHLRVEGILLVVPEKGIVLARGRDLTTAEAGRLGKEMLGRARQPDFDDSLINEYGAWHWLPVHRHAQDVQGIFGLRGSGDPGFSWRRLRRAARYVASHIEAVLDRDFDPLTGLLTWPVFARDLAVAAGETGCSDHSVLAMNIDRLHVINDSFGRESGDEVLVHFATLLRQMLPHPMACRVTGDSFVALLRNTALEEARAIAEAIGTRLREKVYARGDETHRLTVSIGVAPLAAGPGDGGADALAAAQVACKAAKERGRARVEVYEPADASIIRRVDDIHLVGYVRNAIENNRLALVGQRLLALRSGRVAHYFEVLVRIVDDAGKLVAPAEFISAAERYQLMEELDRWVVAHTLKCIARSPAALQAGNARFAINLSGQSLGSDSFLAYVESTIGRSGVDPRLLCFEITESVAVARMQQAQAFMHALKKLGCRFSLDDFGTGLSSFAYLKLFPVDTLKIDGSFVRDITTNVVSQSVVAAIAEVARVMQLDTVAEYVQDEAAMNLLRNLNISYAQGFLVGAAEPLAECIATAASAAAPAGAGAVRRSRSPAP